MWNEANIKMDDLIKKLKSDPAFIEFLGYIQEKLEEIDTVSGLEGLSNEQAGEEAKIRSKVRDRLHEILKPFIEFQEKKEPTEREIKKAKETYGL